MEESEVVAVSFRSYRLLESIPTQRKYYYLMSLAFTSYVREGVRTIRSTAIILHGILGSKANWHSPAKALVQYPNLKIDRVVCADIRNHGDSPHQSHMGLNDVIGDVLSLMEDLECSKTEIMGHSFGGKIAMALALSHPEKVSRLIVVDTSPRNIKVDHIVGYMKVMQMAELDSRLPGAQLRKAVDKQLTAAVPHKEVRQFLLTNLSAGTSSSSATWKLNLPVLIESGREISRFPEFRNSYTGPVHFIGGVLSPYLTVEDHPRIYQLFPRARLHSVPDAGHWVHSDNFQGFVEAAATVFSELPENEKI